VLLLGVTLFWSSDPVIGLDKLTSLIVSGNISFILFNTVIERHGSEQLARLIVVYLFILLACAIPYKIAFGFFDRSITFFINGAIVFARLMCIATLLSLFILRGKKRIFAVIILSISVIWTGSKGPILAIMLTLIGVALLYAGPSTRKKFYWYLFIFILLVAFIVNFYVITSKDFGRLGALYSVFIFDVNAIDDFANAGSFGARIEMWSKTISLIPDVPFGLGLGAWSTVVITENHAPYPHNLFLELWSEGGVILGSLASLPFLAFLFAPRRMFWFVAFCLFLAQMVSGDLSDARFLMVFSFLACFSRRDAYQGARKPGDNSHFKGSLAPQ
jgi:hypothetical protein